MDIDVEAILRVILPDGWSHDAEEFRLAFSLFCPHGHEIEQDGECPDGCVSPLRDQGWI